VFLGSGAFAVPVVERVARHPDLELRAVVTAPPRAAGRGGGERPSPVGAWALGGGLPVLTPQRLRAPDSVAAFAALLPELVVLADYGQIVPGAILDLPHHGALNLHPSLLPRHRGATPIPPRSSPATGRRASRSCAWTQGSTPDR
jgi:methionyl-tRNA formyltransferase